VRLMLNAHEHDFLIQNSGPIDGCIEVFIEKNRFVANSVGRIVMNIVTEQCAVIQKCV